MPGNFLNADIGFPNLNDAQGEKDKFSRITDYLYMLLEQLRYTLGNLGQENFNAAEIENFTNLITEPLYMQLADEKQNIASLMITENGLISRMNDAEDAVSNLTQTQNGMTLSVENESDCSTIRLMSNGVQLGSSGVIQMTGLVKFSDLSEVNTQTVINGGNISTGIISAVNIEGVSISGSLFKTVLPSAGTDSDGELQMYYAIEDEGHLAAGLKLDNRGQGTSSESSHRLFLYTKEVTMQNGNIIPFALKLESAGGISLQSKKLIYIESTDEDIYIHGKNVHINGNVYINETLQ